MDKFKERISRKGYGFTALWLAVVAAVCAIAYETVRAYTTLCMYGGTGCLSESANNCIGGIGTAVFILGALLAILALLSAVESIAVMEKTKKAYVALSIIALTLISVSSGLIYMIVSKTAYAVFG